jgi:hypothetical protein
VTSADAFDCAAVAPLSDALIDADDDAYFGIIAARARCADVTLRVVLNVVTPDDAEETSGA